MGGLDTTRKTSVSPEGLREAVAKRHDVLAVLLEEPMTKPELVDRLTASRSTIDRAIRELEEVETVERIGSTYHPTTSGKIAFSEFQNYVKTTETLTDGIPLLEVWPDDSPISPAVIRDAEVHVADSHTPENALTPIVNVLKSASKVRVLMPVVLTTYLDILETFVEENCLEVELVVEDEILGAFDDPYWSANRGLETASEVRVHTSEAELPFTLWLIDTDDERYAGVTVHERGGIRGVILNESPDAVEWATDHYETYRDEARRDETQCDGT